MSKPATHKIITRSVQAQPSPAPKMQEARLYRIEDGLLVATAKDVLLQFGEDPNRMQMRVFLDHSYAIGMMRKLADRDWAVQCGKDPADPDFLKTVASGYAAVIETVDADSRILPPNELGRLLTLKQ